MRLIDADELMEHVYRDRLDSRELIAQMVENAPTVKINVNDIEHTVYSRGLEDGKKIARPTGKWIYSETECDFVCSECGEKPVLNTYDTPTITDLPNYQFCRNCGAKMRVKNELSNELKESDNENNE